MSALILDPATSERCAWTIVHSLWQGLAVFALLRMTLRLLARASARARYVVLCLGLVALVAFPVVTFWLMGDTFDDPGPLVLLPLGLDDSAGAVDGALGAGFGPRIASMVRALSNVLVAAWLAGAILFSLRHVVSWLWLHRVLLLTATPLRDGWTNLSELAGRMGLATVRFLESNMTDVPATIGWLKPVVLLPPAALTGLTIEQVEVIVAHELAHVLRRDYVVNLLQTVAETVLFYHPAVWWVSARLREERENCCDDIAVRVSQGPKLYALALVALEERRLAMPTPQFAMAATGGPLFRRIARLVGLPEAAAITRISARPLIASVAVTAMLAFGAAQVLGSATVVRPPRALGEVRSLSSQVYEILEVRAGATSMMPALDEAVTALRAGAFTPQVGARLAVALNESVPEELSAEELSVISLDDPLAHQTGPNWRYGTFYERVRIARLLWELAQSRRVSAAGEARLFSRAALLLLAQDSSLFGATSLRGLLTQPSFAAVAELNPRQFARLRRHVEDHQTISRVFVAQLMRADRSLATAAPGSSPAEFIPAMWHVAALAPRRPDIQWCLANLLRRHSTLVGTEDRAADVALVAEMTSRIPSPDFARWMADTKRPPPLATRRVVPVSHEELADFRNVTRNGGVRRGGMPEAPSR